MYHNPNKPGKVFKTKELALATTVAPEPKPTVAPKPKPAVAPKSKVAKDDSK